MVVVVLAYKDTEEESVATCVGLYSVLKQTERTEYIFALPSAMHQAVTVRP